MRWAWLALIIIGVIAFPKIGVFGLKFGKRGLTIMSAPTSVLITTLTLTLVLIPAPTWP